MTQAAIQQDDQFSYDEVPYESFSYHHTHPQHLYTIGTLFNMDVPDFKTARVLELGCASGGNLFPIALQNPDAQVMGIDLSQAQIDEGQAHIEALGLDNVTLKQMDILDFPEDAGEFDYIICHGILSWVPEAVQGGIMRIFERHLADNGLAHVSYNCLPGWHNVRALREMMLFHTNRFSDPKEKIQQSRAFLNFIHDNTNAGNAAYKQIIDQERKTLNNTNDSYIFHDHLEDNNNQFYLHEINTMLQENGLQYVGDTNLNTMFVGNLSEEAVKALGALKDNIIQQEQYMDFINNRRFRNTIVCKKGVKINRNINQDAYKDFYITANFKCADEKPDINGTVNFVGPSGQSHFAANKKAANALFLEMAQNANKAVKGRDLVQSAAKKYKLDINEVEEQARTNMIRLYLSSFIKMRAQKSDTFDKIPSKPKAFKLARRQALHPGVSIVTNMDGETVPVDMYGAFIMTLMDGTRTQEDVTDLFLAELEAKGESINKGNVPITDPKEKHEAAKTFVETVAKKLLENNLLEA